MAKKKSKREWFIPMFEQGMDVVHANSAFNIGTLAFDSFGNAHAFAAHIRLTPVRDENDQLVLDKQGNAIMPDYGKITVIQVKTDKIDWKNVTVVSPSFHLRGLSPARDVIEFNYEFPYSKHSIVSILEESDEVYNKSTF